MRSVEAVAMLLAASAASASCESTALGEPITQWREAYLVLSNPGSSSIYAMEPDGTFLLYRPNQVDGNAYPCQPEDMVRGDWCVGRGRLYRRGENIFAKIEGEPPTRFYIQSDGQVCAPAVPEELFEGQCEREGFAEASGYFEVWPNR